ncbi:protease inhibitor I9 family protein, partial [Microvirga sp. 3-52]|nr:protease inhibitor I9 family protein [Microvirga sp. 3-52]
DMVKHLKTLEKSKEVSNIQQLWVINGIAATVTKDALEKLAKRKDIKSITEDIEILMPEFEAEETKPRLPEWGLEKIFAPRVWGEYDLQGKGIVVGIMDTGVTEKHEA